MWLGKFRHAAKQRMVARGWKLTQNEQKSGKGSPAAHKNQLYYGDNLDVLRRKIASESVDLCYIDPPFNSKRNYFQIYNNQGNEDRAQAQAFVDTWNWGDEAVDGLEFILDINRLDGQGGGLVANGRFRPSN